MASTDPTGADIVKRYADDIAYIVEQTPATDLDSFIAQLATAASRFDTAGINGHEDLETAGTFLSKAKTTDIDIDREVILRKADDLLYPLVWDMTREYRENVAD